MQGLEQHLNQHKGADHSELELRRNQAMKHYRWIQAANRRGRPYSLGVNHLVTWLPHEKKKLCGRMKVDEKRKEGGQEKSRATGLVAQNVYDRCGDLTGH